jgi:hypothetical protein
MNISGGRYIHCMETEDTNPEEEDKEVHDNSNLNQITMELMVNHKLYKKCLEKSNQNKFHENEVFTEEIVKNHKELTAMIQTLFDDFIRFQHCDKYTNEVNLKFNQFIQAGLEFIRNNPKNGKDTDEMFATPSCPSRPDLSYTSTFHKSYWGKQIHKS